MIARLLILIITLNFVSGQINGEFWWLNDKLAKLQKVEPSPPKFDSTNEFETDESVKIIFKDNELYSGEAKDLMNDKNLTTEWPGTIVFQDHSELVKPVDFKSDIKVNNKTVTVIRDNKLTNRRTKNNRNHLNNLRDQNSEDVFEFVFPENDDYNIKNKSKNINMETHTTPSNIVPTKSNTVSNKIAISDKIWFDNNNNNNNLEETESICTFLKKNECIQNKGVIHMPSRIRCSKHIEIESQRVCCILPLARQPSQLKFPGPISTKSERNIRSVPSVDNASAALKQRNTIMHRKFISIPTVKPTASATQTQATQKIVTDDYVDPYWNVKNSKFRPSSTQSSSQDYYSQDYADYAVELPKPGLVGLYSDFGSRQTTWKLTNTNKGFLYDGTDAVSEEEDDGGATAFGYSTFDPRLDRKRLSTKSPKPIRRKPMKIMASSEDMQQQTSQTISFLSKPDFHVLEGFKLLNLGGNKNGLVKKTANDNMNQESNVQPWQSMMKPDDYYDDFIDTEQQVYKQCGRIVKNNFADIEASKGESLDPWLALAIQTKSRQKILCYATILHPRAAVTAADCVHSSLPGEISILAGIRELKSDHSGSQQRLCTVHAHPQFMSGDLESNIALLHWKRPVTLDVNIQPACLADPHVGDTCYFVGWGGYDQAMERVSRRQLATILTPRKCSERISKPDITLPQDAFCASVTERGTVTGVGGPLLCRSGDITSIVGVAVWREDVVVLLPVFQWVATAMRDVLLI